MAKPARELMTGHVYDGIEEYDNPTPSWWTWIFVATIVFSVLYFMFFHVGTVGWTLDSSLNDAIATELNARFGDLKLEGDEATLLKYMNEPEWLLIGQGVFKNNCVTCHGADASGGTGPNLTDDYYKNVKRLEDIVLIIRGGKNAMPTWEKRLHPNQIVLTAAYVATLRGKHLPGRPPEGEIIPPWPKPPASAPADAADAQPGGK